MTKFSLNYRCNSFITGIETRRENSTQKGASMANKQLSPLELIREFHLKNDEINRKLEEYVYNQINQSESLKERQLHSNIGGWHSDRNLHANLGDGSELSHQLILLLDSFSDPINEYINSLHDRFDVKPSPSYLWDYTGTWFNVAYKGSYNSPHVHPSSQISAAYYIRTEPPTAESPFSGRIDFIHDNIQYGFFPTPGTLILFPGEMLHWVHPYYGSGYRICFSFNSNNIRMPEGS